VLAEVTSPSRTKFLGDKGKSWKLFEMLFKWRMGEIEMEYAHLSRSYLKLFPKCNLRVCGFKSRKF